MSELLGGSVAEPKGQLDVNQEDFEQVVEDHIPEEDSGEFIEEPVAEDHEDVTSETQDGEKQPYTPEEIRELLDAGDFSKIDTSRLSDEGKLLMRSMQAGLTPKLQEASEIRKQNEILQEELKAIRQQIEQKQKEPETIYDYYDQDPEGTVAYIENTISEMMRTDPEAHSLQIKKLEGLLRDLERYEVRKLRQSAQEQEFRAQAAAKISTEIPNFGEIREDLSNFAKEMFGYTDQELARLTDIGSRGWDAVDTVIRLYRAYKKVNAKKAVHTKRVPHRPTKVEEPSVQRSAPPNPDYDHFELRKKAARGEVSWTEVFLDLNKNN